MEANVSMCFTRGNGVILLSHSSTKHRWHGNQGSRFDGKSAIGQQNAGERGGKVEIESRHAHNFICHSDRDFSRIQGHVELHFQFQNTSLQVWTTRADRQDIDNIGILVLLWLCHVRHLQAYLLPMTKVHAFPTQSVIK